jgi:two-component system, cell cycle sensor histidine kinase and response regulator CckA
MTFISVLTVSVVLQFLAALLALRLIWVTRKHVAWLLIAAALSLMALRRCYILWQLVLGRESASSSDMTSEIVALTTSALMLMGVACIVPLFRSIHEAQRDLQENRAVLQAILDASPIGICLVRERIIEWANGAMERMLGYSPDSLCGQSTALIYPDSQEYQRVGEQLYLVVNRQGEGTLDAQIRCLDGAVLDCCLLGRLLDPEDPSKGHIVAVMDMTERKELEQRVIHSQKMEAIGRLAGGVAHDFNNLLTTILGYADLLMTKMVSEDPMRRYVGEIRKAAELAAIFTRKLLAFSRKELLQPTVLDVNAVLDDTRLMLERLIGENILLDLQLTPELGHIKADQAQIEQIIINLLVNARDAMPEGGRITIETANTILDQDYAGTHLTVRPGPHVMLAVSDTGRGMDAATRARIFEPFFTTKEKGKGTGLGLATIYGIVKHCGGSLWVYSEEGRGSTFKVYFPMVDEEIAARDQGPQSGVAAQGTETVLLAEDETGVRDLAREVLQDHGYTVLEAADGVQALRVAEEYQGHIDLLITDVVMPNMSGRELADRLSAQRPAMKVLYISGYTGNVMVRRRILAPGMELLQKPFTPPVFAAKIREVLERPAAVPEELPKSNRT